MKTTNQIELIEEFCKSSYDLIGQKSFKLFQAFLLPFDLYTEPDIPESHHFFLSNIPSIEDEMESKFDLNLGTRHWSSPLKYECEDDRHLFDLGLEFILNYEQKYPNPGNVKYSYKLRNDSLKSDLLSNLGHMGYRPEMYFGISELACLRAYLDGYFRMKQQFELSLTEFESKLLEFILKYKSKKTEKYRTWDRNYRWEWDFAVFGTNERHAIPRLMQDIESYTGFELKLNINQTEIKVDWSDFNSWSKSSAELLAENKA